MPKFSKERWIPSLLYTDLYKLTQQQMWFERHPDMWAEWRFKCRNKGIIFTSEMLEVINDQLDKLCTLRYTEEELSYLNSIRFMKPEFLELLRFWYPRREYVDAELSENGELEISIFGPVWAALPFEIYVLSIVNETYFKMHPTTKYSQLIKSASKKLVSKIDDVNSGKYTFNFSEFGTRRALSTLWEETMVKALKENLTNHNCVGTSNVYLAMKYGMKAIGTIAHESIMMYQGMPEINPAYANEYCMKDWNAVYRGDLGIFLTDTLTTPCFLKDFSLEHMNSFTGVRHDSGDPFMWGEMMIERYIEAGIDPKTKTLLFSDSLNFEKAQEIYDRFNNRCKVAFGIGTFLSNDTDVSPLNIVVKVAYAGRDPNNLFPVAKISDNPGKSMCVEPEHIEYLKHLIENR